MSEDYQQPDGKVLVQTVPEPKFGLVEKILWALILYGPGIALGVYFAYVFSILLGLTAGLFASAIISAVIFSRIANFMRRRNIAGIKIKGE